MNFWYTKIKDNIPTAVTFNYKYNKNYILTNFDPLSRWKVSMIADLVEWVRVVSMFICNMSQEWIPLSQDEAAKTRFGRCSTPIKVSANSLHPILDDLTSLLFTCSKQLFGNWPGHMPNVKEVSSARAVFSNPFGYTSMTVRDKHPNFNAKPLQKAKAPFYSFKLCLVAATSLICL